MLMLALIIFHLRDDAFFLADARKLSARLLLPFSNTQLDLFFDLSLHHPIPIFWCPDDVVFAVPNRMGHALESAHSSFLSVRCGTTPTGSL